MRTGNCCVHHRLNDYLLFFFSALLLFGSTVFGQKGNLSGIITDSLTSKPVAGASIELNYTFETSTDQNGEYILKNIPKGKYQLTVAAGGYRTIQKDNFFISGSAQRSNFALTERVMEIPGVTIKPRYFQRDINEFTGSIRFNSEEIKRISGNLDDVSRTAAILPGVAQIDNSRNDLIVRGGSPAENLFTVDGIVLPTINHFGNQGFSGGVMSFINMDYIGSTSFSTGCFSAAFGDKISSVMQVNLREGRDDKIGAKAVISATQFALNAEGPVTDKSTFILSARRSYLDLVFRASGFSFAPEYYDFLAKTNTKLNSFSQLSFLFIGVIDRVKFFNPGGDMRDENPRAMGSNQNNIISAVSYKNIFSKGYFSLSLSSNFFGYETVPNRLLENKSSESEHTLKSDFVLNLSPDDELDLGSMMRLIRFNANVKLTNYSTTFEERLSTTEIDARKKYMKAGLYAQYNRRFGNAFKLGAGLRADFSAASAENGTLSPRIFGQFFLSSSTNLNFGMGIYRQSPNYLWSSLNAANEKLKSFSSNQLAIGLEHVLSEDTKVTVEGFFKKYRNYPASIERPYLIMANAGAGFAGTDDNFTSFGLDTLVNAGKGSVRGIEIAIQKRFSGSPFWGNLNVTLSQAVFEGVDGVKRPGSYDQNWIIHLAMGYVLNDKWEIDLKFRYASGIPYTPFDMNGRQDPARFNSARLEAQHGLDVRLDRKWIFNNWKLRTYLDIQNIYNHKVRTIMRWERKEGRIAEDPVLGIVPSIGISVEL